MSKTIVMMGGNGYIGRHTIETWLQREPDAHFIVASRSGESGTNDVRVRAIKVNCDNAAELSDVLPDHIDAICCFVGGMDPSMNIPPVKAMCAVAKEKGATCMGYVQGKLGSKAFVESKAQAAAIVREAGKKNGIKVVIANPSLVYGGGRKDALAKMVPLLKFFGIFNKNMKPVTVEEVAKELVTGMCA